MQPQALEYKMSKECKCRTGADGWHDAGRKSISFQCVAGTDGLAGGVAIMRREEKVCSEKGNSSGVLHGSRESNWYVGRGAQGEKKTRCDCRWAAVGHCLVVIH